MTSKPIRISYTANEKYQNSPQAYFLHYVKRIRERVVGSALPFGNAIDNAINEILRNKMNNKPLMENVVSIFEKAVTFQTINGIEEDFRTSENIKFYKNDVDEDILIEEDQDLLDKAYHIGWVCLRRKGLLILDAYIKQAMPHLKKIISVQDTVAISDEEGNSISGFIDFVAQFELDESVINPLTDEGQAMLALKKYNGKIIIFDNKTSSQRYKEDSVRLSKQLATYFENPSSNYNAEFAGYVVIPKKFRKKKEPKIPIEFIIDKINDETVDDIFAEYADTIAGIKAEQFQCHMGACQASPFGCPYMRYCQSGSMEGLVDLNEKDVDKVSKV
jgi:hypothetical protein